MTRWSETKVFNRVKDSYVPSCHLVLIAIAIKESRQPFTAPLTSTSTTPFVKSTSGKATPPVDATKSNRFEVLKQVPQASQNRDPPAYYVDRQRSPLRVQRYSHSMMGCYFSECGLCLGQTNLGEEIGLTEVACIEFNVKKVATYEDGEL
ncbi:unnamed protein product [Hydatigera taeniaeformis]|uniref:Uncharacterized protein n=1 Tax=Hydatigena taeniaeformis TaxID=6205 RepID=A0A0R3X9S2_HYDTA|nr:unnamed protein product [Hydatigera taeniaeformis]